MNTVHHRASPCTQKIQEHTPIYDLEAYKQRQHRLQRRKLLKNTLEVSTFAMLCMVTCTLFLAGV